MEKKIKLVVVLAHDSRHIVGSCWGKQRCILMEGVVSLTPNILFNTVNSHF